MQLGKYMKIPFGKYKGCDIDALASDLDYAKWMLEQDWVLQKYPELFLEVKELLQEEKEEKSKTSLDTSKNMLVSVALKSEKIEDYSQYPLSIPFLKNIDRLMLNPHVTFIIGENGSGKSTLLEALAITQGFNPEGGTVNFNFSTKDSHSNLHEYLRISKTHKLPKNGFFLRAESFYNVATAIENIGVVKSYGNKPLHQLSHGEAFLSLIQNRFGSDGLYILDEPEAALSPQRQMSVLILIDELVKMGSQFIISTHSPILLSYPNSTIYEIKKDKITKVDYEETETFAVTKDFLNNYKKMLSILLK